MSSPASAPTERRPDHRERAGTRRRGSGRRRPDGPEGLDRLRVLLGGAMGAVLGGYALLVPVAAVLLASGGSGSLDGAFTVAVPMWLAAYRIPVQVDGRTLGVLPLLPTVVVGAVVALAAGWSVRRLGGRVRHDAGAVVAVQAGAAAAVAVLAGALLPGDVAVITPWSSMVGAGLLAGLAAGAGVLRTCGPPPAWAERLRGRPSAALRGLRAGLTGLAFCGAVVLCGALLLRAGAVAGSFAALAPDTGSVAGVLVLAVGYLPNALVGATAWALGPGVTIGVGQYGPFGSAAGPVPGFPLAAVLSPDAVPGWAALVLLAPLGVGVVVGRVCRTALGGAAPPRDRLAATGAAVAGTAVVAGVVAALAGGRLAGGPYDPVSLSPVTTAAAALVLLGVPAVLACADPGELLGRRRAGIRPGSGRAAAPGRRSAPVSRPGADGARSGGSGSRPARPGSRFDGARPDSSRPDGSRADGSRAGGGGSRSGDSRRPAGSGARRVDPAPGSGDPDSRSGDPGRRSEGSGSRSGGDGPSRPGGDARSGGDGSTRRGGGDGPARRDGDGPARSGGDAPARPGDDRSRTPDRPRTVGELVAQREREPEDGTGPADR